MQFQNIENYIEFLAGRINQTGKSTLVWAAKPPINLASYDVGFITSVADQIYMNGTPLTDRQAMLAERLIDKYQRQLRSVGIDQPDHKNYRLGIRVVDRDLGLFLKDDKIHFKFPFNSNTILKIKEFAKTSQGEVCWDKESRAWTFALTEYNLSWAYTMATNSQSAVTVDQEVKDLFELIVEAEQTPYEIQLKVDSANCGYIENGPSSMIDYINEHVGFDDLHKLVDYSGSLAYSVSDDIIIAMEQVYGNSFIKLCANQSIDYTPATSDIEEVLKWANIVGRSPVVVYNPNFAKHNRELFDKYFTAEETQEIKVGSETVEIDPTAKLVYTNKILSDFPGPIPLLISYANLMHGESKKAFLAKASKVVYYCERLPKR